MNQIPFNPNQVKSNLCEINTAKPIPVATNTAKRRAGKRKSKNQRQRNAAKAQNQGGQVQPQPALPKKARPAGIPRQHLAQAAQVMEAPVQQKKPAGIPVPRSIPGKSFSFADLSASVDMQVGDMIYLDLNSNVIVEPNRISYHPTLLQKLDLWHQVFIV